MAKKVVLTDGYAIVSEPQGDRDNWFPDVRLYDWQGNHIVWMVKSDVLRLYDVLKETFLGTYDSRNHTDRDIDDFSSDFDELTFAVIAGFLYLFPKETNKLERIKNSLITIDSEAAKAIVKAIEKI